MIGRRIIIAYLFGSLNRGGTETLFLDVFRNASKASFNFIGVHRKGGAYQDEFYAAGPKMVHLTPKRFGYVRYLMQLRRLLKSEHVTIVHAQHWLDCFYARLATIGTDIRVMITLHGFFSMNGITGKLCRWSIRKADEVCFVSQYEKEWYQARCSIPDKRCHVIYNGVDFSKIDSAQPSLEFADAHSRIRLAMVGNFVSVRSQNTIVRSIQILSKRGLSDFELYFIGRRSETAPQLYDECVRICEEYKLHHVHFSGGRGDVPSLLKSMDGFVYSTNRDTFGIAIVEAMAAGLPIVVNDYPVIKEVCDCEPHDKNIIFYKTDDIEDCANAIQILLENLSNSSKEMNRLCATKAKWVREKYSIENYIATLSHIYRKD